MIGWNDHVRNEVLHRAKGEKDILNYLLTQLLTSMLTYFCVSFP